MAPSNPIAPKGGYNHVQFDYHSPITDNTATELYTKGTAGLNWGRIDHSRKTIQVDATHATPVASDLMRVGHYQTGVPIWMGTLGGSANAYTASLAPAVAALVAGMRVRGIANHDSTGAATLNLNGIGATAIRGKRDASVALGRGAIRNGDLVDFIYDGTYWRMTDDFEGVFDKSKTVGVESGSLTSSTLDLFTYHRNNKWVHCNLRLSVVVNAAMTNGYGTGGVSIELPATRVASSSEMIFPLWVDRAGTYQPGLIRIPTNSATGYLYSSSAFQGATGTTIFIGGFAYETN